MKTNRELIFHIGAPKTATTLLQRQLFESHEIFSKSNINYFNYLCYSDHTSHFRLFKEYSDGVDLLLKSIRESPKKTNILSSEILLFLIQDEDFRKYFYKILKYCADENIVIKVVGVVREPVSYLMSCYGEDVIGGRSPLTFDEWLESDQGMGHANVPDLMIQWEEMVSKNNVMWIFYQSQQANPTFIGQLFKKVSGIDMPILTNNLSYFDYRSSFNGSVIEAVRRINAGSVIDWKNFYDHESHYVQASLYSRKLYSASASFKKNTVLHPTFNLEKLSRIVNKYNSKLALLKIEGFSAKQNHNETDYMIMDHIDRIRYNESKVIEIIDAWINKEASVLDSTRLRNETSWPPKIRHK